MPENNEPTRGHTMGAGVKVDVGLEAARAEVASMAAAMKELEKSLRDFGNNASMAAQNINRHLKSIGETAEKVAGQVGGMSAAVAGVGSGTKGATSTPSSTTGGSTGGGFSGWISSAQSAINSVRDKQMPGGLSMGTFLGNSDDFAKDLMLAPLRFLRSRINTNRDTALMASGGLNMVGMQQGASTQDIMTGLSRFPGSIMGSPQELIGMFGAAPGLGASFGFGNLGPGGTGTETGGPGQGVRARGFFEGIRQMQAMNPLAGAGQLTQELGGYSANTGAQQRSMMLTGGAMSMIATGGRQKSLSEWAESILRWFEGLRPGKDRGKGFDYGQLMAQYFPGSNIDAWFNVNQVPQNMRDYWWTYALGKARKSPEKTTAGAMMEVAPEDANVAYQRLRASTELTRTEFSIAGSMAGQYANREQANRWFNQLMGTFQRDIFARLGSSPIGGLISKMPDSIEDLLMTGIERGASELFGDVPNAANDGDIGDSYGAMGGTGLSGLHPDMRSKIARMQKANPRVQITSGLRDTGLQQRLKASGHSRVSGKPSAHTRGMAADLGPRSQYGWIARNANRFGLASGRRHGEPWHVGMAGDIGDPIANGNPDIANGSGVGSGGGGGSSGAFDIESSGSSDALSDALNLFSGFDSSWEGLAGFVSKIFGLVGRGVGKVLGAPGTPDAFDPGVYDRLIKGTKLEIGLSPQHVPGSSSGGGGGEGAQGVGGDFGSHPAATYFQSSNSTERAAATAAVLFQAGFRGNMIENMTAIAGRESSWTPSAHRTDTVPKNIASGDRGLLQINYTHDTKLKQAGIISTSRDLLLPEPNARAAFLLSSNGTSLSPWSMSPGGWNAGGDPMYGAKTDIARAGVAAAKDKGWIGDVPDAPELVFPDLGDIGAMARVQALTPRTRAGDVSFHNEFNLSVPTGGTGSNGGIDVRRTVSMLADHLEDEMKRRLARTA